MTMRDKLRALTAQLRLHGVAEALDGEIERAECEVIAAPELLWRLLSQDVRVCPFSAISAAILAPSRQRKARAW
jgi:hypothetical protein